MDRAFYERVRDAKDGRTLTEFDVHDVLNIFQTCPGGDLSLAMWGPDAQDPLSVCRPLGVEAYRVENPLLKGWSQPERAAYKGLHGLHIAKADWEK